MDMSVILERPEAAMAQCKRTLTSVKGDAMRFSDQTILGAVMAATIMAAGCSQQPPQEPSQPEAAPVSAEPGAAPVAQAAPASSMVLDCTGAFTGGATPQTLAAAFGAENVVAEELSGPEGSTFPGYALFGNDPARRIEVVFHEPSSPAPEDVGGGAAHVRTDGSLWTLPSGIKIGSGLAEVVAANGKPFKMSGLGWDMGGYVIDWQGGALGGEDCPVSIRFDLPDDTEGLSTSIMGDTIVSATSPELARSGITVSEIQIGWSNKP